jgi:hypothetical protein
VVASRAFPTQPAVTPFDARCSLAVPASSGFPRASPRASFAPARVGPSPTSHSPFATHVRARATPTESLGISPISNSTEVKPGSSERPGPLTRSDARSAHIGASGSRKVGWSFLRQARACDFRALLRLSVRTRGARLGARSSRCSPDLWPLRGLPARPLGLRPPLLRLLGLEPPRPKTDWLGALRHYRVSIRPNLGATPKTDSNLRGVCNLVRSPKTLEQPWATPGLPCRRTTAQARPSSAD